MEKVPAEMMREFVRSQKFTSTDEVMTAMKNMFKDILQEVMECELADELGYEKSEAEPLFPLLREILLLRLDPAHLICP